MEHIIITDLRIAIEYRRDELMTDKQFEMLLAGFKRYVERRGFGTRQAVEKAVDRGWMSTQMAIQFISYATE